MNNHRFTGLCALAVLLLAHGSARAQSEDRAEAEEASAAIPSREVEISEDNYRRFMELKDQPIERALPINTSAAQSQAGLEKMQRLPEASQKHLRDQLRELIVESGPWSPASPQGDYPFVPSEAALGDGGLRQQEAEAWEELVGQYHEREAAIYAARQAGSGADASAGGDAGRPGSAGGADGAGSEAGQAGAQAGGEGAGDDQAGKSSQASESAAAQAARRISQQPSAARPPRTQYRPPDEGTEQSALEFLTGQKPAVNNRQAGAGGQMTLEELERARGIGVISAPEKPPEEEPPQESGDRDD